MLVMVHHHLFLLTGNTSGEVWSHQREGCAQVSLWEKLGWGGPSCGMLSASVRQEEVLNFLLQYAG